MRELAAIVARIAGDAAWARHDARSCVDGRRGQARACAVARGRPPASPPPRRVRRRAPRAVDARRLRRRRPRRRQRARLSHAPCSHLLKLQRGAPPAPEVTVPQPRTAADPASSSIASATSTRETSLTCRHPDLNVPRTLLDLAPRLAPEQLARACHEHGYITAPGRTMSKRASRATQTSTAPRSCAPPCSPTSPSASSRPASYAAARTPPPPPAHEHRPPRRQGRLPLAADSLTIELLSYRFHASRHAFEQDVARRRRSNHVAYTYGDVFERGAATAADVARRLSRA